MLHVTENTVDQRPATQARFRAPDFASGAESLARGAGNLAAGVSQATENLDKIGEMYDTAAVKQADAEDLRQIAEIRAKVMSSKGFDTQTAIAEAWQQIGEIRKARLTSLHNVRQQRMYGDVFDQRNLQLEESFANHSATQIAEANKQASLARADSYADLAVDTFGTKAFDDNLNTALNETAALNSGMGPDAIARQQAKVKSSILSKAIDGMIADPDQADHAQLALQQHAADILPDDELQLRKKLNPILEENRTDADAGWAFTNAPKPQSSEQPPAHPADTPATPPRAAIQSQGDKPVATSKAISPADPLRGKGRITDNAAAHRARGSGNALDIAAPEGTPIYTPMSGKVVKSWWDQKGGWSVLVEHPNGYVTGYAHLRSQSPFHEGQAVDPSTPIGSVGQTGDATGPHVHYTVREGRGAPKVDPAAALWNGRGTVKPDTPSWKEAEPVRYEAEENDLGRALSRLHDRATAENWSPNRYNKAVDRVRQIAGVQNQLYDQQQEERYNSAIQTVVNLGDKFTSVSQIPNFGLLKPTQQLSLQNIAKGNQAGGVQANSPTYLDLLRTTYQERDRFIKEGPQLLNTPNITNGERADLYKRWLDLTSDPNGQLNASMDEAAAKARRYLPKDYPNAGRFMDQYVESVQRRQKQLGRDLSPQEREETARALVVHAVRYDAQGHQISDDGYVFETGKGERSQVNIPQTYNSINPSLRQQIVDGLASKGLPHSMKDVVAVYLQQGR